MAGFDSESGSEYGYDLTASDEERLFAIADRLSELSPRARPAPVALAPEANVSTPVRATFDSSQLSPEFDSEISFVIEETIAAITDDDLSFDISELQDDVGEEHGQCPAHVQNHRPRNSTPDSHHSKFEPQVSSIGDDSLASLSSRTKPRSVLALLPDPEVCYPDLSRALSEFQEDTPVEVAKTKESTTDKRSPLLRFRTFPMKPFSVSDLTAGAWCELQYFYTLTRLPDGKKTRTAAMKRGTKVHEELERELFKRLIIEVAKKEDNFGLKIWNMIQGLRVLRDQGYTREFEVWGMVEGNLVCGVIDGLSYDNPDEELQDDVMSSRGNSQTITNSQPYELSTPGEHGIYITDVKTRNSATPPPQSQVRVSLIQLFLYHRFISDMAADRLDYMRVFERYGLNPDEPFSDSFLAQIGAIHEEVFTEAKVDTESAPTLIHDVDSGDDEDSSSDFVSAPSSPLQRSSTDRTNQPTLKYRTLRTLLPLLKHELALTFPRGASDLGKIVAVEYRYRGRDPAPRNQPTIPIIAATDPDGLNPDETDPFPPVSASASAGTSRKRRHQQLGPEPERGSVICTHTFFVEPETLDLFLAETLRWWKGERPPHGVPLDEAGFKCRSCEFYNECDWRREMDMEARRRAERRKSEREGAAEAGKGENIERVASAGEVGDIEDGGVAATGEKEGTKKRRGRPKKLGKGKETAEDEQRQGVKRGRLAKLSAA
ncbi:exonuclease V [Corynascus similis CBS 632.67]